MQLWFVQVHLNTILPFYTIIFMAWEKMTVIIMAKCFRFFPLQFVCVCEVTRNMIQLNSVILSATVKKKFFYIVLCAFSPTIIFFLRCSFARIITLFSVIFTLVVHLSFHFLSFAFDVWIIFHISECKGKNHIDKKKYSSNSQVK